jgi:asparagine synthase (glutamine-hydrolysing)
MCGIAGIVSFSRKPVDVLELQQMIDAINHRGPDDEGFALINRDQRSIRHFSGNRSSEDIRSKFQHLQGAGPTNASIGLAHCRFSIIDLSSAAHQPFSDSDGMYCLAFNGEIYNYIELKKKLEALGSRFRTASDTEVFLEAYRQWDTGAFNRMNGFWAAALYDVKKNILLLCRDRLGKKPLYYTEQNDCFYFASEIKALISIPSINRRIALNEAAAYTWLSFNRKNLGTTTFFKGIELVPKATYLNVGEKITKQFIPYWRLPDKRLMEKSIGVADAAGRLRELLINAVTIRLRSDVPVGLELSGGIDSSVLCAVLNEIGADVPCYTVQFNDTEWNEESFARSVAGKFGKKLTVLYPPNGCFWKSISSFTCLEEEPYHSPNLYSSMQAYIRMREAGIKVSLNGAGGDECFAGYPNQFWSLQWEHLLTGNLKHYFANAVKYSEKGNILMNSLYAPFYILARKIYHLYPMSINNKGFSINKNCREPILPYITATLSGRLHNEMDSMLMPYWLASGDRTCMGVPLEVRAPFLDYRIVEFAFTLPISYLIRDGWHKWILRKTYEDVLPGEVLWRRKKMGFPFPIRSFLCHNKSIIDLIVQKTSNPYVTIDKRYDPGLIAWRALSFILWYEYFIRKNYQLFNSIEAMAIPESCNTPNAFMPGFLNSSGR